MADDEGVLGNLPKSRPGRRSSKREAGAGRPSKAAAKAATKAEVAGEPAAKPPPTPKARRTSAKPGRAAAGAASPKGSRAGRKAAAKGGGIEDQVALRDEIHAEAQPEPAQSSGDALSAAVRAAAGLAVTGVRVASAVTQELLRRLPRP